MSDAERKKVIISVDGSDHSRNAFQFYLNDVHKPGNYVIIAHCMEWPYFPLEVRTEVRQKALDEEEERSKATVKEFQQLLEQNQLNGKVVNDFGRPGEYIVALAEKECASMIITGTRGLGQLRRTILGSVSDYVVHHAHCPVVVGREASKKHTGCLG